MKVKYFFITLAYYIPFHSVLFTILLRSGVYENKKNNWGQIHKIIEYQGLWQGIKTLRKRPQIQNVNVPTFLDEFAGYIKKKKKKPPFSNRNYVWIDKITLHTLSSQWNNSTAQKQKVFISSTLLSSTGIRNNSDHTVKMEKDLVLLKAPFISHLFMLLCICSNTYS